MKRSAPSEQPTGRPGDAAAQAFEDIRRTRKDGQRPPSLWSALSIVLIVLGAIVAFAFVSNRTRRVPEADYVLDEPVLEEGDAAGLAIPPDLGEVPELATLVAWPAGEDPPTYADHVTVMWFKHVDSCTSCWMNSRYWKQVFQRYWPSGLQVISVVDIAPDRLRSEDAIWTAVADPGGMAAAAFVGGGDVPEDYVVVVDRQGHLRFGAEGKPSYDAIERIIAKLLWAGE